MRRGRRNRARRSGGARRDRRRGALRGEPDPRPRGAPRVPRARRPLHARRLHSDGDPGGVARRRVAREAVSRRVARPRLHPRRPRTAAVLAARAVGRRDARERSRVDPRRRRCGERGRRAVARGAARPRERRRADRAGAAAGDAGQSGAHMRAVTFGELLLRLSPPGDERLLESPELHTCFGGAEANVAVALSHLGVRCDYVTRVPDNPLGDAGVEALRKEGVGTRWIARGGICGPCAWSTTARAPRSRASTRTASTGPRCSPGPTGSTSPGSLPPWVKARWRRSRAPSRARAPGAPP